MQDRETSEGAMAALWSGGVDRPKAWCVYMYAYVHKCTRRPK